MRRTSAEYNLFGIVISAALITSLCVNKAGQILLLLIVASSGIEFTISSEGTGHGMYFAALVTGLVAEALWIAAIIHAAAIIF